MKKFSQIQNDAIRRTIKLFSPILEKNISSADRMKRMHFVEGKIIKKRLKWYDEHKGELNYTKCEYLTDIQKAFIILFRHRLKIDTNDLRIVPIYDSKQGIFTTHIQSRNFCPYLEAFKRMKLKPEESIKLCRLVLEKPCQALIDKINPKIKFSRDYSHIRPLSNYCDERLILKDYSRSQPNNMQINIRCSLIEK